MAKKVEKLVKLQIPAGKATPAPPVGPATGNEFVINIKDTSVLNVISVVELYFSGNTVATQTYQYFQTFTIIAVIYFVLTFTVTRILRYIEKRMDMDTYTTGANQMQTEDLK